MRRQFASYLLTALLATPIAVSGCTTQDEGEEPSEDFSDDTKTDTPYPDGPAVAYLEIYAMDIWGQWLPGEKLTVLRDGQPISTTAQLSRIALNQPGTYTISLSAPDHDEMSVEFKFDGSDALTAFSRVDQQPLLSGLTVSRELRTITGRGKKPVHSVYLGLTHKWFAPSGRPARPGNQISLIQDGENTFKQFAKDVRAARSSIMTATWWWEGDFELERSLDVNESETARAKRTVQALYDASPATKRVMVNQFAGQDGSLSWVTVDSTLRARGAAANDKFEFMGQTNPTSGVIDYQPPGVLFDERVRTYRPHTKDRNFDETATLPLGVPARQVNLTQWPVSLELPIASYHQKFHIIDDKIAYIGGMNFRGTDWDTSEHRVYDPRRMAFGASNAKRQAVADKKTTPDQGPRKDYMLRITGPSVADAKHVFGTRWNYLRSQGAENAQRATDIKLSQGLTTANAGARVQVTATMPAPFWEYAIAESWLRAIGQAESFIYIEDQYFRAPTMNAAIIKRMREVPNLQLVVITKPVNEWTDPGCEWTARAHQAFAQEFPSRYRMFQLQAFDTTADIGPDETAAKFVGIDVHAKMLIIDDKFMSVGSANKNDRGMVYEGELNAAVFDATFVKAEREKIIANILGAAPSGDWIKALSTAASANDAVRARWSAQSDDISLDGAPLPANMKPTGFIYTLNFNAPNKCLVEGVGPDMT